MTGTKMNLARDRGGTYVLVFDLGQPVENRLGSFLGRYCYVGSARGPGGLHARVARHLRKAKPLQWHIDLLTSSEGFRPIRGYAASDVAECRVALELSSQFTGHPGFGCSDCRCATHLFHIEDLPHLEAILKKLRFRKLDLSPFSYGHR